MLLWEKQCLTNNEKIWHGYKMGDQFYIRTKLQIHHFWAIVNSIVQREWKEFYCSQRPAWLCVEGEFEYFVGGENKWVL